MALAKAKRWLYLCPAPGSEGRGAPHERQGGSAPNKIVLADSWNMH